MKFVILLVSVVFSSFSYAQTCSVSNQVETNVVKEDVNTPARKALQDAFIIVKTKDGKEYVMSANDYKVVPRKQQFKTTSKDTLAQITCTADVTKNSVALGVRRDHTGFTQETSGNTTTVYSKKDAVVDVSYMRHKVIKDLGLGVGIDTNGVPSARVGLDF